MKYRCMVWYRNGRREATPSLAYGDFKEHDTIDAAMGDMIALKMTSMKASNPGGNFFATVVGYPDGHAPTMIVRSVYLELGGE